VAFGSGGPCLSSTSSHPIVSPGDFGTDGSLNQHQIAGFPLSFLTPVLQDQPSVWPLWELAGHLWLSTGDLERFSSGLLSNSHPPQPQPTEEELLTVEEVAHRLRVSRATAYSLCRRGDLVHVRVGKSIRVRPEVLTAFIAGTPLSPGDAQPLGCGAMAENEQASPAPNGLEAVPEQIEPRAQHPAQQATPHRHQRA
jgi:excisionase family DNA binding protein